MSSEATLRDNALRRSAQDSEASASTESAPATDAQRRLLYRRSSSSHNMLMACMPTAPLAIHIQSASMLVADEPDGFETPENSESSETSASLVDRSTVVSRFKHCTGPLESVAVADDEPMPSGDAAPAPSIAEVVAAVKQPRLEYRPRPLQTIPEHSVLEGAAALRSLRTFSKVLFNPDPHGQSAWQTYLIPDDVITHELRAHLAAATSSDELDPLRICECSAKERLVCVIHAPPDMVAKVVPCYFLDRGVARIRQYSLKRLLAAHKHKGGLAEPGIWQRYRAHSHSDGRRRVSNIYKFKMFYA